MSEVLKTIWNQFTLIETKWLPSQELESITRRKKVTRSNKVFEQNEEKLERVIIMVLTADMLSTYYISCFCIQVWYKVSGKGVLSFTFNTVFKLNVCSLLVLILFCQENALNKCIPFLLSDIFSSKVNDTNGFKLWYFRKGCAIIHFQYFI